MSLPADAGFSAAVTDGHTAVRGLFGCDATGTIIEALPMDAQTGINVGNGLVRRSGTLVIPNRENRYTPGNSDVFDSFACYRLRYMVKRTTGHLVCDQPLLFPDSDTIDLGGHVITIPVSDGMRIVNNDAGLTTPLAFPDGTALEAIVRSLLVACGAPDDDAYFDLQSGGKHVAGIHGYEVGMRAADVLTQLQDDWAVDIWAAPPLVYTMRPVPDASAATPVATWTIGKQIDTVPFLGLAITRVSRAKNHAIVEGVDRHGQPFTRHVYDLNPDSPVMWNKLGVGDLSVPWKSDGITDPDQADEVGRSLLVNRAWSRTFQALVPHDPSLDRRDVVRIVEPLTGTDTLAMLDEFPVPAAPGSQQITVLDARSLSV